MIVQTWCGSLVEGRGRYLRVLSGWARCIARPWYWPTWWSVRRGDLRPFEKEAVMGSFSLVPTLELAGRLARRAMRAPLGELACAVDRMDETARDVARSLDRIAGAALELREILDALLTLARQVAAGPLPPLEVPRPPRPPRRRPGRRMR